MGTSKNIAARFREVMLNGKWVAFTNYKERLADLTWEQATTKIGTLNTIAALTFHINYYISGLVDVFEGGDLLIRDKFSFDLPPITTQEEWENLRDRLLENSEKFASLVEAMPDGKMEEVFVDEKYGTYRRNIDAMIEHGYYHLGQISLLRKLMLEG